jgi:competence protein ComEA
MAHEPMMVERLFYHQHRFTRQSTKGGGMKKLWGILFGVVCGLLGAGILYLASRPPRGVAITLLPPPTPEPLVVQVDGAVVNPGVYELPMGSRVRDAVKAAGGFTAEASEQALNQVALLQSGQRVDVPAKTPTPKPTATRSPSSIPRSTQPGGQPSPSPSAVSEATPTPGPININTASLEELDSLPDIGPVTAQKIIEYRQANGPFTQIEDILKVTGIGPAKFEKIKDKITVGD